MFGKYEQHFTRGVLVGGGRGVGNDSLRGLGALAATGWARAWWEGIPRECFVRFCDVGCVGVVFWCVITSEPCVPNIRLCFVAVSDNKQCLLPLVGYQPCFRY